MIARSADLTVHDYDRSCYRMGWSVKSWQQNASAGTQIIRCAWLHGYSATLQSGLRPRYRIQVMRMIRDSYNIKTITRQSLKPSIHNRTGPPETINNYLRTLQMHLLY
jgi:hypothetical protein